MQRKLAVGLALVVVVVGFLGYWFGLRDRGGGKKPATTVATDSDPWAKPRAEQPRPDAAAGNQGGPKGGMPRLSYEVDPAGTFALEGQVLDEEDHAVAGAVVRISSSPPRTATTNATGEFRFDKLLGRTYSLTARAGDKLGGPVSAKGSSPDPVVIRLRQATTLEVTVSDARSKKPIAGARVMLLDEEEAEETTGADGVARFPVAGGWTRVAATAKGYAPNQGTTRVGRGERSARLTLTLQGGAALSGRVLDEQGQPVAGARVWPVDAANAWQQGAGDRLAVTSGTDGAFSIPVVAAGSWILFAKDDTHAQASTRPITVSGEEPTTGVEIVMPTAAALAGVVVDDKHAPVPYATVQLSSDKWSADMVYRQAAAGADGRFELKALPRRSFKVRARSDDATSDAVAVDLTGVAERKDLELVLSHGGTIAGVVVDSAGEAVAEAEVSAMPDFMTAKAGATSWILAAGDTATTDGDGHFVLHGLEDGQYRLFAVRDAGGQRQAGERAGTVAKVGDQNVRLVVPSPGAVVGKIVMESGGPPPSATITAGWEDRTTTTDGSFRLGELLPGTYDIRVSGSEFAQVTRRDVVVAAGKEVDLGTITVRPGRKVAGKVVDGKGAPVAGARVLMGHLLFGDGKRVGPDDETLDQPGIRQAVTGADGAFLILGASRTGGSLLADHGERGRSVAIVVPAGKDDVAGLTLTLVGYGSVAGKVTRKGQPVTGVTVSAAPTGSSGQAVFVPAGADGSFVFDKVPAGPTSLLAMNMQMMKSTSGGRQVVVVEGTQIDGSIELPVGDITLTLHVKALAGQRVDAAQVFLFPGVVNARNALDVTNAYFARTNVSVDLSEGRQDLDVGMAAGMSFWLGNGDPTFEDILPGRYTVCGIPITGNITDTQLTQRLMANLDKVLVVCAPITVAATPEQAEATLELPAMPPLPAEEE